MQLDDKINYLLNEVGMIEKITVSQMENCKKEYERNLEWANYHMKEIKLKTFLNTHIEDITNALTNAKKYSDCYVECEKVMHRIELINRNFSKTKDDIPEQDKISLDEAYEKSLKLLSYIYKENSNVIDMFVENYFYEITKDSNGIKFYIDNDTENQMIIDSLRDFGSITEETDIEICNYCIEYAKKKPEIFRNFIQSTEDMLNGMKI